jgi:hypothetical protein
MEPSVCVDRDSINFGGVKLDNLKPNGFSITNCGSGSLIINISLTGANPGDFTLVDYMKRPVTVSNALLNGDQKCAIYLMFKPGGLGNREALLTIQSNVPGRTIWLTGVGLPPDGFGTSIDPLPSGVVCSDLNS